MSLKIPLWYHEKSGDVHLSIMRPHIVFDYQAFVCVNISLPFPLEPPPISPYQYAFDASVDLLLRV